MTLAEGPCLMLALFSACFPRLLSPWSLLGPGHAVDGPQKGPSPRLWDIKVQVPPMFQEDTKKLQVPHSSLVKVGNLGHPSLAEFLHLLAASCSVL